MPEESVLKPAKKLTLGEFVDAVQNLAEDMLEDHEDMTGENHAKDFSEWLEDLTSAYLNSNA